MDRITTIPAIGLGKGFPSFHRIFFSSEYIHNRKQQSIVRLHRLIKHSYFVMRLAKNQRIFSLTNYHGLLWLRWAWDTGSYSRRADWISQRKLWVLNHQRLIPMAFANSSWLYSQRMRNRSWKDCPSPEPDMRNREQSNISSDIYPAEPRYTTKSIIYRHTFMEVLVLTFIHKSYIDILMFGTLS